MAKPAKVHLLDVGTEEYGDALLCQLGDCTVLIDGAHRGNDADKNGHPAIQKQIRTLLGLGANQPCHLTLVVVSHAHDDHIGCLPKLVADGQITCKWALVVDPDFGWGRTGEDAAPPPADARAASVFAALREEPRGPGTTDDVAKRTRAKKQQSARGAQKPGKLTAAQLRAIVHKQDAALGRAPRQVLEKLPGVDAPRATPDRVAPDLPRPPGAADAAAAVDDDGEMVIQVEPQHEDAGAVRIPPRVTIVSRRQRKVIGEQG